jgi:23S rRNA pseudouridine1911/1915/1917 synthase
VQTDLSRNQLQSLIRAGAVQVNGRAARAAHRLRAGDHVVVELPAPRASALTPEPIPLAIVHEDADILVIDKPAGLVVHPGAGTRSGTLVHALLHHAPEIAGVGGEGRPGIVHRLDKDTSGLMVVARSARAHRALVEALRAREVTRVYRALVWGDPTADTGTIEGAIGRHPRARTRMAVVRRGGRPARTHWRVRERFGVAAHLDVQLDSGRTHQIRVHLAHAGLSVLGDPVYGGRPKNLLSGTGAQRSLAAAVLGSLRRQALHAAELAFSHPVTGVPLRFTSELPADLRRTLDLLRAAARDA